jgi:hypothetical protein
MARFPTPEVAAALNEAALSTHVPLSLLWAVAFTESTFDPSKLGPVTASGERARGLMQLMPATVTLFKVSNPLDATQSALAGAKLLERLGKALNWDVPAMLAAYNWGPTAYARAKTEGRAVPPTVARYVKRVLAAQGYYRGQVERPKGTLMHALNAAIEQLAADNPNHVPATQLRGSWREFFAARGNDGNVEAVLNPSVRTFWQAYKTVFERAPIDLHSPDPSLVEPDFWARASKAVDAAVERVKEVGEQAALGLGAGLFLLAVFVFASGAGKRRR